MSLDDIIAQSKSSRGQKTVIGPDGLPRNRRSQQAGNPRRGAGAARSAARSSLTPYSNPRSAPASIPAIDQSKLSVSNLNHNVTSQDFRELFSTIGPVKSAVLNFDHTGKSTGTGTVIYKRAGDTQRAITEFNGRLFDGRPMRIELVVSATNIASLTKPLVVPNNLSGGQRGAGANSRGARGLVLDMQK
ncbi:hypothetical protein HDU82_002515 [Entophlyctis luteolus]|nr:hypothetical protein HDU82_002515 [Entophlyctis luteolus]